MTPATPAPQTAEQTMNYHWHHRRLRALLGALAFHIASGSALLPAQTPPQEPPAARKIITCSDLQYHATSSQPEDRSSAADYLASQDMDFDLFMKLMTDPDAEVRLNTLSALDDFCSDPHHTLPPEVARQMIALMEQYVTDVRILAAFADKDSKKQEDEDIAGLCDYALALDTLYQHTPFLRTPDSYKYWQERVLKFLVICLASDLHEHGDAHEEYLHLVLAQITAPDVLTQSLQFVLEKMDDLPTSRQISLLEALWAHPQLGAGKPLNLILLQQLGPVWEPVRDHILRNLKGRGRMEEATALLTQTDTAFTTARQQLSAPPAKAGSTHQTSPP